MRQKCFFLICCLLIVFASGCTKNKINESNIAIEEVGIDKLEPALRKWTLEKENVGVYIYTMSNSEGAKDSSKYLVYSIKESSYERQMASARMENNVLYINIDYKMAENDHLVNPKYIFEVSVNSKPEKIEVYRKGQKINWGV